ncbi:MAG TPA: SPOR domain-containing protein [Burkholderiaceae bacterium]|nr:SPOR domain-containing protein [Burkholderiaceae bacterium]
MLRWLVVALVAANLGYWAWSAGWLNGPLGWGPAAQREPDRLAQQINPQALRVLGPGEAAAALAAASAARQTSAQCLEAGPFTASALEGAEQALASLLPERGWIRASRELGAQFGVVIGPLVGRDAVQKKEAELKALRVAYEEARLPGEREPALVLARFDARSAAEAELDNLAKRGVRTARVAATREAGVEWRLRLDNASPALAAQLRALSLPGGSVFGPCAN